MAYKKKTWVSNEIIRKEALNNIEDGIESIEKSIPKNVSQLVNDSEFIRQEDLHEHDNLDVLNQINLVKMQTWDSALKQSDLNNYVTKDEKNISLSELENNIANHIDNLTNELDALKSLITILTERITNLESNKDNDKPSDIPCTGLTLNKASLTFTNKNPQTLTAIKVPSNTTDICEWRSSDESIAIVQDGLVIPIKEGNCTITVVCGDISATCNITVDNIIGTYGALKVSKSSINIDEKESLSFTIKLESAPSNDQIVNLKIEDESCAMLDKTTLTFNAANYSSAQTVTIIGAHDPDNYETRRSNLIVSSANVESKILPIKIYNIDNEEEDPKIEEEDPGTTYGGIVVNKTSLSMNEGNTETFTVKLNKAPSQDQIVKLSLNNSHAILNVSSLIFTSSNYNIEQIVNITGKHDSNSYSNKSSVITVSSTGVSSKTIDVTIMNVDVEPVEPSEPEIPIGSSKVIPWFESAGIEWAPISGASNYNVYYKSIQSSSYTQIDDKLIRKYPNIFRADVLGLKAGKYNIKIVPVINGNADTSKQIVTNEFEVKAHAREGFAFSNQSPMKTGSGGYNDDGTVPSNAQILYVTASNVNDITLDVITSSSGAKTKYTGLVNILTGRQKGYDKTPLIIRLIGQIKDSDIDGLNSNGYLQLKKCYNISLEGVGKDATIYGWGLLIREAKNVEIKNLGIMLFKDDAISLDTKNENIWVHHNDIFYGSAGSDSDQAKGDGSTDVKGTSTYVTIAYNKYWDSGKCSLCGMTENAEFFVTYHHNWFCKSDSRHPRIRLGTIHIYNNFFDGNSKYGVGITMGGSAFVEANDFDHCKYPMLISLQGSDVAGDSDGTFSGENGGMIKAYNNSIVGATRLVYAQDDSTEFDAYLASSRNETVPSSYKAKKGGTIYNNFDTKSTMYNYNVDDVKDVRDIVTAYAGRAENGDFEWEFTSSDNTNYGMISELMNKIRNYKTQLQS